MTQRAELSARREKALVRQGLASGEPDTDAGTGTGTGKDSGKTLVPGSRNVGGVHDGPTPLAASTARQPQQPQAGRPRAHTPQSAGSPQSDAYGDVIRQFDPLRENPEKKIVVRVLELRGKRRVDIREHVTADEFTGFTRRGLSLTGEEFDALLDQRDAIRAALADGR